MKQEPDLLKALTLSVLFLCAQSQCEFPNELVGRNMSSNKLGIIYFKSKTTLVLMEGFRDCEGNCPFIPITFDCECTPANGVELFLRSKKFALSNKPSDTKYQVTMCWYLHKVSDNMWTYFQGPKECSKLYKACVNPVPNANVSTTCDLAPLPDKPNVLQDPATLTITTLESTTAALDVFYAKSGSPKTSTLAVGLGMTLAVLALAATYGAGF
ncbi:uncharacterized protein [Littorina saxatilis]|uniref:Uncharacterized protein n=1 Tax=Littorina saxatilis TaxID=31220 RepID=A0AAN9AMA8_9CAEN